ncbi:TM2 domain-containing protein [Cellulomonas soli]|uniref:TM2 domain-containing protein n=1 Tax=Cellulomonas soli TaxID=931535 RepID=UPI003F847CFB
MSDQVPAPAPIAYGTAPEGKSRVIVGVLGILLGSLGVHNFYLGFTKKAVIQLVLSLVTFGIAGIWGFVEGIIYLVSKDPKWSVDAAGVPLV